jgi:PST family polysaccharide transporter
MARAFARPGDDGGGLSRRAVGGMLWMAGGKGIYAVLQILVLVILARLLAPGEFGVVTAAMVVIGLAGIFSELGLGPALVQRPTLEPRHLQTAFATAVLTGTLFGATLWLLAPLAADFFQVREVAPVLRALALVFPVRGLGVVAESLMQRELRFRWLATLEVVTYAIGYGALGVTLAWAGWGVWALVAASLSQSALRTGALLVARRPRLDALPERRAFRELMYFGGGFTAAKIANYLALQGDNLVVGRWLGPVALGLYGRAYQLMSVPAVLFGEALDAVLFPAMARVQHEPARLATAYRRGVALVALVTCPASAVLVVTAPELLTVVLGERWGAVVLPFQVLVVGLLFRTSYKLSDSLARATGAVYRRAWRQAVYATLVIGGSWIGQHQGVVGVAVGVLAALAVNFLLMAHLSTRLVEMRWRTFASAHLPAIRLAVVAGGIAWAATAMLERWQSPPLLSLLAAAGAAFVGVLLCVRVGPRLFLGPDGAWMISMLCSLAPRWSTRVITPATR